MKNVSKCKKFANKLLSQVTFDMRNMQIIQLQLPLNQVSNDFLALKECWEDTKSPGLFLSSLWAKLAGNFSNETSKTSLKVLS